VYAPYDSTLCGEFLDELRSLASLCSLPWLLVGDFNMTRSASEKNNHHFDAATAEAFNDVIDELVLQELPLLDRQFTWTNNREAPTLVRLDRAFINPQWSEALFNSTLRSLVHNTSDHVPLLVERPLPALPPPRFFGSKNSGPPPRTIEPW
jgi:endonuclease/exonuclease/phosphatase family metal-dependent hydrolase